MGKRGKPAVTAKSSARRRAFEPDRALAGRINEILTGRPLASPAAQQQALASHISPAAAPAGPASSSSDPLPASHFQSTRSDAPPIALTMRGSQADALAAASSDESKRSALTKFEDEKVASSSRKSRASH